MITIGHRCSAHRLFKLISNKIEQPSFFDGCYGDLDAHCYLLNTIIEGNVNKLDIGTLNCKNSGLIPIIYKIYEKIQNSTYIKQKRFSKIKSYLNKKHNKIYSIFKLLTDTVKDSFLNFLIRKPIVMNEYYISRKSKKKYFYRVNHLTWLNRRWTNPGLKYGYLRKTTASFSSWKDRELLTTNSAHYFFTHCNSLDIYNGKINITCQDNKILKNIKNRPTDYFHLSRPTSKKNFKSKRKIMLIAIDKWRHYLNFNGSNRIFVIFPVIISNEFSIDLPFIEKLSEDVYISYLKVIIDSSQLRKQGLFDVDFKVKEVQSQTSMHMLKLRKQYNLEYTDE